MCTWLCAVHSGDLPLPGLGPGQLALCFLIFRFSVHRSPSWRLLSCFTLHLPSSRAWHAFREVVYFFN